jgi:hypothetical protein
MGGGIGTSAGVAGADMVGLREVLSKIDQQMVGLTVMRREQQLQNWAIQQLLARLIQREEPPTGGPVMTTGRMEGTTGMRAFADRVREQVAEEFRANPETMSAASSRLVSPVSSPSPPSSAPSSSSLTSSPSLGPRSLLIEVTSLPTTSPTPSPRTSPQTSARGRWSPPPRSAPLCEYPPPQLLRERHGSAGSGAGGRGKGSGGRHEIGAAEQRWRSDQRAHDIDRTICQQGKGHAERRRSSEQPQWQGVAVTALVDTRRHKTFPPRGARRDTGMLGTIREGRRPDPLPLGR